MFAEYIQEIGTLPFAARILMVVIVSGFMPLTSMTFFYTMLDKKEADFKKAMKDMGIDNARRTVRDTFRWSRYVLPVGFVFLVCFLAIAYILFADNFANDLRDSILLAGSDFGQEGNHDVIFRSLVAVAYAFLGAFIWSSTNIIRRLMSFDLAPGVYYSAGLRIILAIAVSVVLSFVLPDLGGNGLPAISLIAGMFPERVLNLLIEKYKDIVGGESTLRKQIALDHIQGISLSHKERLNEAGIDDAQNLASYSLINLLKQTPFETREVLDWIGQAKLLVYAQGNMAQLREMGIRSVFDLFKGDKTRASVQQMAESKGVDPVLMGNIFDQVTNDEGVKGLFRFECKINLPGDKEE